MISAYGAVLVLIPWIHRFKKESFAIQWRNEDLINSIAPIIDQTTMGEFLIRVNDIADFSVIWACLRRQNRYIWEIGILWGFRNVHPILRQRKERWVSIPVGWFCVPWCRRHSVRLASNRRSDSETGLRDDSTKLGAFSKRRIQEMHAGGCAFLPFHYTQRLGDRQRCWRRSGSDPKRISALWFQRRCFPGETWFDPAGSAGRAKMDFLLE